MGPVSKLSTPQGSREAESLGEPVASEQALRESDSVPPGRQLVLPRGGLCAAAEFSLRWFSPGSLNFLRFSYQRLNKVAPIPPGSHVALQPPNKPCCPFSLGRGHTSDPE